MLRIATLMGMPSERAVVNSCAVIWKQPSPSMHQTVRSGRPTFAPMAAGTPKPIVPAPPELIQVPGSSNFQCCEAHIWCCPTPAATIVPGAALAAMASMTCWGRSGPSLDGSS